MNEELQKTINGSNPHTENALMMLQVVMQKVTAEIIQSSQTRPEYYSKMCQIATDLGFWIRNIEQGVDIQLEDTNCIQFEELTNL